MKFCYPIKSVMRQCLGKDALTVMVLYLLLPIFCNLILYAIAYFVRGDEETVASSHWVKCGITTVLEIILLFVLRGIATAFFDADNQPFAVASLLVTLLLIGLGTAFFRRNTPSNLRNYLRKAAWIAGVVFVLESFVFHYTSFTTHPETTDLVLSQAEIDDSSAAQIVDDTIQISGNCTLTFSNLEQNPDFRYLILNIDGEDNYYNVSCSIKDDNLSNRFEQAGKSQGTGTYSSIRFSMLPYQTLHTVQLQFTDVNAALVLHNGTFHTAVPYQFSAARFFLIVIIALVLTACKQFHVWKIRYRAHSWKHNLAVLVTLFGCMASVLAFRVPDLEPTTLEDPVDINNVYAMTLDAWEKGQTNMDLTPSEELLQSETPYDNSNREGVYYNWDYAYYNQKYYCYFGCAPVALLYVPYYKLTGNVLPLNWAYCIMTEAVIVTLFGLILTLVRKFCKRPPLILLLLGLVSAVAGSGVLFGLNYSDRYYLCILTGMFGLFLSLWTGFAAMDSSYAVRTTKQLRKLSLRRAQQGDGEQPEQEEAPMPISPYTVKKRGNWKRFVLLAISGIGTVITAASRPNMLLYVLILVPVFLHLLFRKDLKRSAKITSAACYLIPVAAGAITIMWYNKIRFDDPFQFGAIYQMTVDNTAANRITISRLPAAIAVYFFGGLDQLNDFPFLRTKYSNIANRQMYLYVEGTIGAFTLPSILLSALSFPFVWKRWKRKHSGFIRRVILAMIAVLAVALAWVDFSMAGVILRYALDILVILSVLSTILLLQVPSLLKTYHAGLARVSEKVIAAAMVGTVVVCLCILIASGENVSLFKAHPTIWNTWKEIFVFWR